MSQQEYNDQFTGKIDQVPNINCRSTDHTVEASFFCKSHGNFCSDCINLFCFQKCSYSRILSCKDIKNLIKIAKLHCFYLKLQFHRHKLNSIYTGCHQEIEINLEYVLELEEEFLEALKEQDISKFEPITKKANKILEDIQDSEPANIIYKFLARNIVKSMEYDKFDDIIEQLNQPIEFSADDFDYVSEVCHRSIFERRVKIEAAELAKKMWIRNNQVKLQKDEEQKVWTDSFLQKNITLPRTEYSDNMLKAYVQSILSSQSGTAFLKKSKITSTDEGFDLFIDSEESISEKLEVLREMKISHIRKLTISNLSTFKDTQLLNEFLEFCAQLEIQHLTFNRIGEVVEHLEWPTKIYEVLPVVSSSVSIRKIEIR